MADEEPQLAQYLTRQRPGDGPMPPTPPSSPAPGPMNKTPNALPPAGGGGLFDDIPEKKRKERTPEEIQHAKQARQDTLTKDRSGLDDVTNKFELAPKSPEEWKGWAKSLNIKNYEYATELDKWLQGRGFTGIMDPKLGPKEKKAVNDLLDKTLAHWYNSTHHPRHKKGGADMPANDPKSDTFTPPGKRSELGDVPSAVSALGGRMMEDEDAA